ncbi:MAG: class I SAM-dependent methyltransferase [Pseudomonadota bacterium]
MTDNADQAQFWSSPAGQSWVTHQESMDTVLQPVLDAVFARAALGAGMSVIDIGCGTGASSLQAAGIVGDAGHVTGFDISPVLLGHARRRAAGLDNVTFIEGDAQVHAFEAASADAIISRFGVMFFADTTAAFANMARALRPGAAMTMAAWGPAPQNPWFMVPAKVARARLGDPPKVDRTLPGPFAFEDAARTQALLEAAGLHVEIDTQELTLDGGTDPVVAAELCSRIGPANSIMRQFEGTEEDRLAIRDGIAAEMGQWSADRVRIPATIHIITARNTARITD